MEKFFSLTVVLLDGAQQQYIYTDKSVKAISLILESIKDKVQDTILVTEGYSDKDTAKLNVLVDGLLLKPKTQPEESTEETNNTNDTEE